MLSRFSECSMQHSNGRLPRSEVQRLDCPAVRH